MARINWILGTVLIILGTLDLTRQYNSTWDYFMGLIGIGCVILGIILLIKKTTRRKKWQNHKVDIA